MPKSKKISNKDNISENIELDSFLESCMITLPDDLNNLNKSSDFDEFFDKLANAFVKIAKIRSKLEEAHDKISDQMLNLDKRYEEFKLTNNVDKEKKDNENNKQRYLDSDLESDNSDNEPVKPIINSKNKKKGKNSKNKKQTKKSKKQVEKDKDSDSDSDDSSDSDIPTVKKTKKTNTKNTKKNTKKPILTDSDSDSC